MIFSKRVTSLLDEINYDFLDSPRELCLLLHNWDSTQSEFRIKGLVIFISIFAFCYLQFLRKSKQELEKCFLWSIPHGICVWIKMWIRSLHFILRPVWKELEKELVNVKEKQFWRRSKQKRTDCEKIRLLFLTKLN